MDGTLHEFTCPACGNKASYDFPILFFRPDSSPHFLYSPPLKTTAEKDKDLLSGLISPFQTRIGRGWKEEWLEELLLVPIELLKFLLNGGPESESYEVAMQFAGTLTNQFWEDEEAYVRTKKNAPEAARQIWMMREIIVFLKLETSIDRLAYIRQHEFMLTQDADDLVNQMTTNSQEETDPETAQMIKDRWEIVNECRAVGIEQAASDRKKTLPNELQDIEGLAVAASQAYQQSQNPDPSLIAEAVRRWDRLLSHPAFEAAPLFYKLWAWNEAATCLYFNYEASHQFQDIERAIDLWQQSIERSQPTSPDMSALLVKLGQSLTRRFERTRNPKDLNKAVACFNQAGKMFPKNSPQQMESRFHQAHNLVARFFLNGSVADLETAIGLFEQVSGQAKKEDSNFPQILMDLANAVRLYGSIKREFNLIQDAIRVLRNALKFCPPGSAYLARCYDELGRCMRLVYGYSADLEDLENAINLFREALKVQPPGWEEEGTVWAGLSNCLGNHFEKTGSLESLEEAIELLRKILKTMPEESSERPGQLNNLGLSLEERYQIKHDPADLEEGVLAYRAACQQGLAFFPDEALRSSQNWGRWAMERAAWAEAVEAFQYGAQAIEALLSAQLVRGKKEIWLNISRNLFPNSAYAAAKSDDLVQAVTVLENGRARLMSESLEQNRRDLERLPALGYGKEYDSYNDMKTLSTVLKLGLEQVDQDMESQRAHWPRMRVTLENPEDIFDFSGRGFLDADHTPAYQTLQEPIEAIRKVPGYENFLKPLAFAEIAAAAETIPMVYLCYTKQGGLALLLRQGQVSALWLPELTEAAVRARLGHNDSSPDLREYLATYSAWRTALAGADAASREAAQKAWLETMDAAGRWLWQTFMGSLVQELTGMGIRRAVLIPCGLLSLLPLHAAWVEDPQVPDGRRYALDQVCFTYSPSARALRSVQPLASLPGHKILAVKNPDRTLPFADEEVQAVIQVFLPDAEVLEGDQASLGKIRETLPGQAVLHFATHGVADLEEPLKGGLKIAQQDWLTLAELLDLRLPPFRLAYLSACETGLPGAHLPDEVVSLPAGFVQAGAAGVIGSLWPVSDVSTMLLTAHFYTSWRSQGIDPVEALRQAQLWLRKSTAYELGLAERYERLYQESGRRNQAAFRAMRYYHVQPLATPFEHPYYWAGFTFTGAG